MLRESLIEAFIAALPFIAVAVVQTAGGDLPCRDGRTRRTSITCITSSHRMQSWCWALGNAEATRERRGDDFGA